ncbi:MAG: methyltransferase [Holosporaceae bacterium]|jgi:tRNA1(Val) A37 N6-methylase TrmN6|nr:methyltransferase [Holosporaceae bacterium]
MMRESPREFTRDSLLNGQLKLRQPKSGYRVAIDPIILSSFVHPRPRQKILDVGCGVGTIALILKRRECLSEITALDIDTEMCEICRENSAMNSLDIEVIAVSIESSVFGSSFDQVVTNPPFLQKKSSRISESKILANFETIDLADWISYCLRTLKNRGIFTMIHRASRLGDILEALKRNKIAEIGDVQITPIFPKIDSAANRVLVQAQKSCKSESKILPGIIVHNTDGSYTEAMQRILDEGKR